jgi:hypothetical protein
MPAHLIGAGRQRAVEPGDHNLLTGRIVDRPAGRNRSPRRIHDLHAGRGRDRRPVLDDIRRAGAERIASTIEARVARVDPAERAVVSQKLQRLVDQWASRRDLQTYWDDYNRRTSLLMSAEQFAAKADVDPDLDAEGARRALWPAPNSLREVEPGVPFVLRHVLKAEGN